ncbi:hypothetical protein FKW77_010036 [Venturia effusa]|uniref:Uncharacterized protein n=1 Tax=Venturia effusa TaxID=50376 RepID=A0A517L0B0_9PEZI|nr:hypothetical protein FKW77_010036 [Venturia effusa]
MKLSSILAFLTTIISVSADAYEFCCCHHKHNCHIDSTAKVVNKTKEWGWQWEMAKGDFYNKDHGGISPYPSCSECYAHDLVGLIGVKQMNNMCKDYGEKGYGDSQCWNLHH